MNTQKIIKRLKANTYNSKKEHKAAPRKQQFLSNHSQKEKNIVKISTTQNRYYRQIPHRISTKPNGFHENGNQESTKKRSILSHLVQNHKKGSQNDIWRLGGQILYFNFQDLKQKAITAVTKGDLTIDESAEEFMMTQEQLKFLIRMHELKQSIKHQ